MDKAQRCEKIYLTCRYLLE